MRQFLFRRHFVVFFAVFLACGGPASAEPINGNTLLEACSAPPEQGLSGFCIGYILGAWEGMNWGNFRVWMDAKPDATTDEINSTVQFSLNTCVPSEVQNEQIKDVVVQYLNEHPAIRHGGARSQVNLALTAAFPCVAP